MSHAAAVWIPGNTHDLRLVVETVNGTCEHDQLDFDLATRAVPPTTCLVAPLDGRDELQMNFDLLNQTAKALSRALNTPTYALYAFFGSGDFLMINAFAADGSSRWTEGSSDDDPPDAPYWKMLEEVSPGADEDVLGLNLKPAFDLGDIDGWVFHQQFVAEGVKPPPSTAQVAARQRLLDSLEKEALRLTAAREAAEAKEWLAAVLAEKAKRAARAENAKKATVKKATVKKATVKKATVKKATVKKATVKKATVKKATAKKATVKKATAKKATVKKPAAKKR